MIRLHSFPTSPFYTASAPPQHAGADVPVDAHHKRNCASEIFPIHFDLIVFKMHTLSGLYLKSLFSSQPLQQLHNKQSSRNGPGLSTGTLTPETNCPCISMSFCLIVPVKTLAPKDPGIPKAVHHSELFTACALAASMAELATERRWVLSAALLFSRSLSRMH